ncbi:MAG: Si-specific NAD(P)(+) transhydrogenase [Pseudomonadales bacterium]|nr:Si-specific NAD(P)(+) transhydrogenase [Pseudomonadales bacterium]
MDECDFLIIGSGPAGQKAAVQGAKAGLNVVLVESEPQVGGMCVHKGTIPSKALRESARRYQSAHRIFKTDTPTELAPLMKNVNRVVDAHDAYISAQLKRNNIQCIRGKAKFLSPHQVEITHPGRGITVVTARFIFIATGSRPRHPPDIEIDHEYVLDSDSILSMNYLPQSMIVLGGGVIACEYASVFLSLGTEVTLVDRFELPLGFLDQDLAENFVAEFESKGGTFVGRQNVRSAKFDGVAAVRLDLQDGTSLQSEKLLVAQGRISAVNGLGIQSTGVNITDLKLIEVNQYCQTNIPHIYAVGDVIGPPSLASSSMEQGRRAACHAIGDEKSALDEAIPIGIFAIPELASVGLTEAAAIAKHGRVLIGYAKFKEVARGLIAGSSEGMLKMIADDSGEYILGVHIVGEGAAELIHLGQMAILNRTQVEMFVEQVFNFPTLAEAYRVAALQIRGQLVSIPKGLKQDDATSGVGGA